jgi:hypothetical protein
MMGVRRQEPSRAEFRTGSESHASDAPLDVAGCPELRSRSRCLLAAAGRGKVPRVTPATSHTSHKP